MPIPCLLTAASMHMRERHLAQPGMTAGHVNHHTPNHEEDFDDDDMAMAMATDTPSSCQVGGVTSTTSSASMDNEVSSVLECIEQEEESWL